MALNLVAETAAPDLAAPLAPVQPVRNIAALWGDADPSKTSDVLNLIQRADQAAPYEFLKFLPSEAMQGDEEDAERTPLGIPIGPVDYPVHGAHCESDDIVELATVRGEAL
ncbi:hypothetical protein [Streptomyces sp. NPDC059455]|uniref:hypothetical protein n=1 Tax=Streptomyces sp. NPDC059455 TaxID=3346837 RepID=UPI0036A7C761